MFGGETSIVREKENIRVFQNTLRSQVRNKRPDRIIDGLDHGCEGRVVLTRPAPTIMLSDCYWRGAEPCGLIPVMGMIFVLWNDGGVDVVIRKEGKERRILAFGDELFCLSGEVNCAVFPASGSALPRRTLGGILVGIVVLLKPLFVGAELSASQMPFAGVESRVSPVFQGLGDCELLQCEIVIVQRGP